MTYHSTEPSMHAIDWIAEHGCRMRTISSDRLRRELGRQRRECTWCGGPVSKGRIHYCSAACKDETLWRIHPQAMLTRLERESGLRCAGCGVEFAWLLKVQTRARVALERTKDPDWPNAIVWGTRKRNRRGQKNQRRVRRWASLWRLTDSRGAVIRQWLRDTGRADGRGHLWEWDHIVPVIEGGGLCGRDGYRCLCIRCHKAETAKLAARRKAKL